MSNPAKPRILLWGVVFLGGKSLTVADTPLKRRSKHGQILNTAIKTLIKLWIFWHSAGSVYSPFSLGRFRWSFGDGTVFRLWNPLRCSIFYFLRRSFCWCWSVAVFCIWLGCVGKIAVPRSRSQNNSLAPQFFPLSPRKSGFIGFYLAKSSWEGCPIEPWLNWDQSLEKPRPFSLSWHNKKHCQLERWSELANSQKHFDGKDCLGSFIFLSDNTFLGVFLGKLLFLDFPGWLLKFNFGFAS